MSAQQAQLRRPPARHAEAARLAGNMKLATFRNGTRDGSLMVVSRDQTHAVRAESVVAGLRTLQQLLDDWSTTELKLERIYAELNESVDGRRPPPFEIVGFDPVCCTAPLPRAYQWADGSAYVNHVELVRRARRPGASTSRARLP